ncbi:putative adenylate cyclase [Ixodes scapularis]
MEGGLPDAATNLVDDYLERSWRQHLARYRRRFRRFFEPFGLRGTLQNVGTLGEGDSPEEDDRSRCRRCWDFAKTLRLEAFFFLYTLAYTIQYATAANLVELKACYQVLNKSREVCENLADHTREDVRNVASLYVMYQSLVGFLPGALVTLVVASWCDEAGRFKVPLCIALFGHMAKVSGELVTAVYVDAPLLYNLLCAIPEGLLGGLPAVLMASYTLTASGSSRKQRTVRFFTLQIAFVLGLPTGQLISALVFLKSGFVPLMASSLGLFTLSCAWASLLVQDVPAHPERAEDPRPPSNPPALRPQPLRSLRHLFSVRHLLGSVRTVVGRKLDVDRWRVPLLVLSVFLLVLNSQTSFMGYFYAKGKFNWTFSTYVIVTSAFSLASVLVLVPVLVCFVRWLPNQEYGLAVLGILGVGAKNILQASSGSAGSPLFFLGYGFGMLSNIAPACVRAHVSRLLPEVEYGRLFSVMAACEALAPLLGRVIFQRLFGVSRGFFGGLSFIVGLLFLLLPLGTLLYFWRKRSNEYTVLAEDATLANQSVGA